MILWCASPVRAAEPRPAPPASTLPERAIGSRLVLHGWSKDSRLVAYTRHRLEGPSQQVEQRMHRFVKAGAFTGFGRMVGGDVARYAFDRGYVTSSLPIRKVTPTRFESHGDAPTLTLVFDVGEAHGWKLFVDGIERAAHRFDRIYVGFEVEVSPSPDGRQAVVVMHLDTGWEIDAAIFAVSLTPN